MTTDMTELFIRPFLFIRRHDASCGLPHQRPKQFKSMAIRAVQEETLTAYLQHRHACHSVSSNRLPRWGTTEAKVKCTSVLITSLSETKLTASVLKQDPNTQMYYANILPDASTKAWKEKYNTFIYHRLTVTLTKGLTPKSSTCYCPIKLSVLIYST